MIFSKRLFWAMAALVIPGMLFVLYNAIVFDIQEIDGVLNIGMSWFTGVQPLVLQLLALLMMSLGMLTLFVGFQAHKIGTVCYSEVK